MRGPRACFRVLTVGALLVVGTGLSVAPAAISSATATSRAGLIYTHRVVGSPLMVRAHRPAGRLTTLAPARVRTQTLRPTAKGTAPSVRSQSSNLTVKAGAKALFSASVSGSPKPSVQWRDSSNGKKWTDIAGAKSATYSFTASAKKNRYRYDAVFTNSAGSVTTRAVTLTVHFRPSITREPIATEVQAGSVATFSVAASGDPTPSVQWRESAGGSTWTQIPGATSSSYSFTTSSNENGFAFEAVFKNSVGKATTTSATLTVTPPPAALVPVVTSQPVAVSVMAGSVASFSSAASGSPSPSVQWRVSTNGINWSVVAGATASTYSFNTATYESGYQYEAVFSNSAGSATSSPATLTVTPTPVAPSLVTQPSDESAPAQSTASFSASASGTPTPTVQWQDSPTGVNWQSISGATSTTYSFTTSTGENGYEYRAVFSNSQGSATSNAATLTVTAQLAAPVVGTQPTGTTVEAGSTASFSASASGTPTPTVQWQDSPTGVSWQSISGATSTTYSFTTSTGENGYEYRAVFSNSQGSATSNAAMLTVTQPNGAPSMTAQPSSEAVIVGDQASFTATAVGTPAPTVQWEYSTDGVNWTPISGATSTTYAFTSLASQEAYEYEATFTNVVSSVTSSPALLTVIVQPNEASGNWSGYADTGATFTGIASSWVVPSVTCSGGSIEYASQWIGIDGYASSTVEQDGTETDCDGQTPVYDAWYEMYGDNAVNQGYEVELNPSVYPVSPGDEISASVTVNNSNWTLSLTDTSDVSSGWVFSSQVTFTAAQSSAEWIVERPEVNNELTSLAEFQPITFFDSQVSGGSGTGGINAYSNSDIEMTDPNNNDNLLAVPSALNTAGTVFSDLWYAST